MNDKKYRWLNLCLLSFMKIEDMVVLYPERDNSEEILSLCRMSLMNDPDEQTIKDIDEVEEGMKPLNEHIKLRGEI